MLAADLAQGLSSKGQSKSVHGCHGHGRPEALARYLKEDLSACPGLFRAAKSGQVEAVRIYLQAGSDVNQQTDSGLTVLHIAAAWNAVRVVQLLLAHPQIDASCASRSGSTALHIACSRGHVVIIMLIMRHPSAMANALSTCAGEGEERVTPLYLAVQHEQDDAVAVLLREASVNPNACSLPRRLTPLHMAAYTGRTSAAAMLLQRPNINLNVCTASGLTALTIALERQHNAIVLLLVEASLKRKCVARRVTPGLVHWHHLCVLALRETRRRSASPLYNSMRE